MEALAQAQSTDLLMVIRHELLLWKWGFVLRDASWKWLKQEVGSLRLGGSFKFIHSGFLSDGSVSSKHPFNPCLNSSCDGKFTALLGYCSLFQISLSSVKLLLLSGDVQTTKMSMSHMHTEDFPSLFSLRNQEWYVQDRCCLCLLIRVSWFTVSW